MIPKAYPGDDIFQKKLDQLGVTMSVWEIRMYLLGLLLSPEMVPPSVALEEILLADTEDEVIFEDEKDHEEFMSYFFGLWNQLTSYDGSSNRYPKLSPKKTEFRGREEKEKYIVAKGDELSTFYMALDESGASEYFDQCFDLAHAQAGLSMINDLLVDFCIDRLDEKKLDENELDEMLDVVDDFHQNWPKTYPKLSKMFLGIRRGEVELDSEEEMEKKLEDFKKKFE